jgi:hypothetical protein
VDDGIVDGGWRWQLVVERKKLRKRERGVGDLGEGEMRKKPKTKGMLFWFFFWENFIEPPELPAILKWGIL